jgi:Concanavalin A-like lectin/glucanases superfamily
MHRLAIAAVVTAALALLPAVARAASFNDAVALTWPGYVDTDLAYSDFFSNNFTITARFMLQYPRAYRGPIVSVNDGSGSFEVGLGDYRSWVTGAKLALKVNGSEHYFYSNALVANKWQHLAVVRRYTPWYVSPFGSNFSLYLNGQRLCVNSILTCGDSVFIAGAGPAAPSGTIRIGRRSSSQAGVTQFYGLVDDVAVFSQALSEATVDALAAKPRLDGTETWLLRGWTFDDFTPSGAILPSTLNHAPELIQGAVKVPVSQTRDNADADDLPLPNWIFSFGGLRIPFKSGQSWRVIQGWGDTTSHNGYAAFALDLALVGPQSPGKIPNPNSPNDPSCGEPIYAAYPGRIIYAVDTGGGTEDATDPQNDGINNDYDGPDFTSVKEASYAYATYMHSFTGSIAATFPGYWSYYEALPPWGPDIDVQTGTKLATVGTRNGCHLHFGVGNSTGDKDLNPLDGVNPNNPYVTYPVGFRNYQACDHQLGADCANEANWYSVVYGVPQKNQYVRAG